MTFVYVLIGLVVAAGLYIWYNARQLKKAVTPLTEQQFKEGYRKAQLIDLREPKEFDGGHILGARNIPMTQMRQRHKEIRADLPVYLYCQNSSRSARAAIFLKKRGYDKIYQLDGGFRKWTGKIKSKN